MFDNNEDDVESVVYNEETTNDIEAMNDKLSYLFEEGLIFLLPARERATDKIVLMMVYGEEGVDDNGVEGMMITPVGQLFYEEESDDILKAYEIPYGGCSCEHCSCENKENFNLVDEEVEQPEKPKSFWQRALQLFGS